MATSVASIWFKATTEIFEWPVFLNFNVCPKIRTFDQKFRLPPNFSDVPLFWILNVRPEIRTFDRTFRLPPIFSDVPFFWILNVRPENRTFDRKFERSTGWFYMVSSHDLKIDDKPQENKQKRGWLANRCSKIIILCMVFISDVHKSGF